MKDHLSTWLARYQADPVGFAASLRDPVVWVDALPGEEEDDERSLHTASGVGSNPLYGEPRILPVTKQKENAFQRGVTVGRTPNNDLVIDDASVSRFHAWFQEEEGGGLGLVDAGSKNGTHVGGRKLTPKRARPLQGGERLRFGHVDAWFLTPAQLVERLKRR